MIARGTAKVLLIAGAGGALPGVAPAAPWAVGGQAVVRAGVDTNPFLQTNSPGATAQAGVTLSGTATKTEARATTVVNGSADVSQYLGKNLGRNSNFLGRVSRDQTITPHLRLFSEVQYTSALNPQTNFGFDPADGTLGNIDYLTIGTRSRRLDGDVNLDWQATRRDTLRLSANGSYSTYRGAGISTNYQYGGMLGYLRTLDARTKVGLQLSATSIETRGFPSSQSYQAFLQVVRQIGVAWFFDGAAGLVKSRGGSAGSSDRTTIGFNGSLCGNYPRYDVCVTFSRQAAPSGIGGLRNDTQFRITGSYVLTERSRLMLAAALDDSTSRDRTVIPRQRFFDVTVNYTRTLARRISVGATGRYQSRDINGTVLNTSGKPHDLSVAGNVIYSFGR